MIRSPLPRMGLNAESTFAPFDAATGPTPPRRDLSRSLSVAPGVSSAIARKQIEEEAIRGVIFPWSKGYRTWWGLTVVGAIITFFTETFSVAFRPGGLTTDTTGSEIIEYTLLVLFIIDIGVSFFVAYRDEEDALVYDRKMIARHYLRSYFLIDVLGVLPFYAIALACAGLVGVDNQTTQYLALLELIKLVRSYRIKHLFDKLQYNTRVSLTWSTLIRNLSVAISWSHFSACVMFFIARQNEFHPENTWIGSVDDRSIPERYVLSLYWAVVTFASVGFGDYSAKNNSEKIWSIIFMLLNMTILSWIIGSMTLLIVKHDNKTALYQSSMAVLQKYVGSHHFNKAMHRGLKTQLKLEFKNREVADEKVLTLFPSAVRRNIVRKLYLPTLLQTSLMQRARQQFVDAFLTNCSVEMFTPGEELLERGSTCSDLYLLVEGVVTLVGTVDSTVRELDESVTADDTSSTGDSTRVFSVGRGVDVPAGEFINDIAFFTETPQTKTVRTKTICKTLTMAKKTYDLIAQDHPCSVGKILQNLLAKLTQSSEDQGGINSDAKGTTVDSSVDGSIDSSEGYHADVDQSTSVVQKESALDAMHDIIRTHVAKKKDDNTTRFLFAAARGDITMLTFMADQGVDPNCADYDMRTALMVASMKGNTNAVKTILDYGADPDLVDVHGTSALYEAAKNGHDDTLDVLLDHGAKLKMNGELAASTLCQAVYDNDITSLGRLLRAGIPVDAADYDKRTALHIAAAEGNVVALRLLVQYGANLSVKDRWSNTLADEARRSNSTEVLEYLSTFMSLDEPVEEEGTNPGEDVAQSLHSPPLVENFDSEVTPAD